MIIVGDIGNSETKICLVNSKGIIIKRVTLITKKINQLINLYFAVLFQNHLMKLKAFLIKLIKLRVTNSKNLC